MVLRALALATVSAALFTACDSGTDYPSNLGDDEYNLEAMALTEADMPPGLEFVGSGEIPKEDWALNFDVNDEEELDAKVAQLEAQGWLRNYVAEGGLRGFGKLLGVKSISTLYTNETAAIDAAERFACGLPIELSEPLEDIKFIPKMGEQTVAFYHRRPITDENGETILTFIDTTICFRTGRIVHAVQETAIEGVEDIASSIRIAQTLLARVDAVFEGDLPPADEDEEEEEG